MRGINDRVEKGMHRSRKAIVRLNERLFYARASACGDVRLWVVEGTRSPGEANTPAISDGADRPTVDDRLSVWRPSSADMNKRLVSGRREARLPSGAGSASTFASSRRPDAELRASLQLVEAGSAASASPDFRMPGRSVSRRRCHLSSSRSAGVTVNPCSRMDASTTPPTIAQSR